ncbi:alpha/beta hydrolase domain-containing protein [Nocardioides psychrotolerans]|uniref:alpha/beta hydrolase domain-containing protein n=1 Tax=Nocardioides psychrotolerans TaxID=1005945 RepID=UPI00313810CC
MTGLLAVLLLATGWSMPVVADPSGRLDPASVAVPRLSAPPAGLRGSPLWDSWHLLGPFGYTQREYLVSGVATALDGSRAPYTTRIIVTRPRDERDFNGTVMLDWVNVTAQFENAVDSLEAREMLLREGFAFVHVSVQAAGLCCSPLTPQVLDPVRYAAISHPGDDFAADMFTQVARALRGQGRGLDPMPGLGVERIIAAGQSQSASRLYSYVNEVQSEGAAIDGFLIHGGGEKTFDAALDVPVLHLLSDREADPAPPTRDRNYRLWEVAGAAHSDYFIGVQQVLGQAPRVAGRPAKDRSGYRRLIDEAGNYGQVVAPLQNVCTVAGATMPNHYAVSTALHQLNVWVRTGRRPALTPRYEFSGGALAKDADRNTRGGIRLAPMEVPVATYESTLCNLGGITVPFSDAEVQQRYGTFARYQRLMGAATDRAVEQGWLLRPDARDQMRRVCRVRERFAEPDRSPCRSRSYRPPAFGG